MTFLFVVFVWIPDQVGDDEWDSTVISNAN
jgi:hypothetical protein